MNIKLCKTLEKVLYKPLVASLKRCCPTSMAPPLVNDILKPAWPSQPPEEETQQLLRENTESYSLTIHPIQLYLYSTFKK